MASSNSTSYRHGHSRRSGWSKTYAVWHAMLQRCYSKNDKSYKYYGGRGIKVCDRWRNFVNFLEDMGEAPPKLSIERKDHNGDYEPKNCEWVTHTMQMRNRRNTVKLTFKGETKPLAEWAEIIGINYACLYKRYISGYPDDKIITMKVLTVKEAAKFASDTRWKNI